PSGPVDEDDVLRVGDLDLDERSHEVTRAGQPIELTARDYEVLPLFMRNPRAVLSKTQILARVWDYDFGGNVNIVVLYVSYLRKKIDAPFEDLPNLFHTKRGEATSCGQISELRVLRPQPAPADSADHHRRSRAHPRRRRDRCRFMDQREDLAHVGSRRPAGEHDPACSGRWWAESGTRGRRRPDAGRRRPALP